MAVEHSPRWLTYKDGTELEGTENHHGLYSDHTQG